MGCPYTRFYATELYENPLNKKGTLTERIFFLLFFKLKNRQKWSRLPAVPITLRTDATAEVFFFFSF